MIKCANFVYKRNYPSLVLHHFLIKEAKFLNIVFIGNNSCLAILTSHCQLMRVSDPKLRVLTRKISAKYFNSLYRIYIYLYMYIYVYIYIYIYIYKIFRNIFLCKYTAINHGAVRHSREIAIKKFEAGGAFLLFYY